MNFVDPSGLILDTIADIGFIAYDVFRLIADLISDCPQNSLGTNLLALGADVLSAGVPFFSGGGLIVRGGKALKAADRVGDAARSRRALRGDRRGRGSVFRNPETGRWAQTPDELRVTPPSKWEENLRDLKGNADEVRAQREAFEALTQSQDANNIWEAIAQGLAYWKNKKNYK